MYPVYSIDTLKGKSLAELKAIASTINATASDKRSKQSWIDAIVDKQPQPVEPIKFDVDGDEVTVDGVAIASVVCDDHLTQPWVVSINGVEVHRTATWAQGYNYTCWHYKQGTLPVPSEPSDDYLFHDDEPQQPANLPVVGDRHHIGDFVLACKEIAGEYAAVWEVRHDKRVLGDIRMGWDTFWTHTMSFEVFATPQEATVSLYESLQKYEQELIDMRKKARELQVGDRLNLRPSACLGHALDAPAQDVEIARVRKQSNSGGCRVTVWVIGQERPYAWLRGSCVLTVEHCAS